MTLRYALCNEVLAPWPLAEQCRYAAALGYMGLELAPYTLAAEPHRLPAAEMRTIRRTVEDAGLVVTGLHWLLAAPAGLSITSADAAVRRRTVEVMESLVDLCAELGGRVLVHGSPAQRRIPPGESHATALARAIGCWAAIAPRARAAGVTYCIEPLSTEETDLVNTIAEALAVVDSVGEPALATMIDCKAAAQMEPGPLAGVFDRWLPTGRIAHIQVNSRNRRGPGQGDEPFAEVIGAIRRSGWAGVVAVEPFDYVPDGAGSAARAIGHLTGIEAALDAIGPGAARPGPDPRQRGP